MDIPVEWIAPGVTLILAGAGYLKNRAEVEKIKASRIETKGERDSDSREIRDTLLKHDFAICQLKDSQQLTATVVDDLRDTCAALNTSVAKLDLNVVNLADAIKELRK
jgi:hypothetical protein